MARVAKIQGDVFDTIVVQAGVVEYVLSNNVTPNDSDVRVTPVILGKAQNTEAFNIPAVIVDAIRKIEVDVPTPTTPKGK
jgi:hypothetical protein